MAPAQANSAGAVPEENGTSESGESLVQTTSQLENFADLLADLLSGDSEEQSGEGAPASGSFVANNDVEAELSPSSAALAMEAASSTQPVPAKPVDSASMAEQSSLGASQEGERLADEPLSNATTRNETSAEGTSEEEGTGKETEIVRLRRMNAELTKKVNQLEARLNLVSQEFEPASMPLPSFDSSAVSSAVSSEVPPALSSANPNPVQTPPTGLNLVSVDCQPGSNATKVERQASKDKSKRSPPFFLLGAGLVFLGFLSLPWAIFQYRERQRERQVALILAAAPELTVYSVDVDIRGKRVLLGGKLPNRYLSHQAERLVRSVVPDFELDNSIIIVEVPPDPVQVAAEVQQVAAALNQIEGIALSAQVKNGEAVVEGTAPHIADVRAIAQAFEKIPGVKTTNNRVELKPLQIATRIYFDTGSAIVKPIDIRGKLLDIKKLMQRYPNLQLKIVGHTHPGETARGQTLALKRAQAVQTILEDRGIDRRRMQPLGERGYPDGVAPNQQQWLSRCVLFEIVQND